MTVTVKKTGAAAIISVNNPPVNALSQEVRQKLYESVSALDNDPEVAAVILICEGRTFIAGADIKEFGKPPMEPHLPDVIRKIELAQKPWIAAIHGTALGGGLEIAMGCHGRIATADARLGLPEVNLGLLPGAGGTVRLPRLVPAHKALEMIAGGKPIPAADAHNYGLVDHIAEGDLLEAALAFSQAFEAHQPTLSAPVNLPEDLEAFDASAKKLRKKARGQLSIPAAIDAVSRALDLPPAKALEEERRAFIELKASEQSKALRHIFFAERKTLSDPRCKGAGRPIERVGVIGGGTMGAGIAAACLLKGLYVTLVEQTREAATNAGDRVLAILDESRARGILTDDQYQSARAHFSAHDGFGEVGSADLIIEAVFEDLDVKCDVFRELDKWAHPDAILATNTSYLDVNIIADSVRDPSRVIGLHFFSPAHIMKLLEIVVPQKASDLAVASAASLAKRLGKIGVLAGVCDGFIANRIMSSYRQEADFLLQDGALPWQIDGAMREFGFPMGIFEMQDLAGLDISWAMRKRRASMRDPQHRYVPIADQLCKAGRFGRKTGKGWYLYDNGRAVADPFVEELIEADRARAELTPTAFTDDAIMERILAAMTKESRAVLDEEIALSGDDIDVVMINGYGFPRWRGGPMFMSSRLLG